MCKIDIMEQITAAKAYEELFVPSVFGQWAPHLLKAAQISAGDRVLDVACGTGILAREAAALVGSPGLVTGLDISSAMLNVANEINPYIEWKQGIAENLPFSDHTFNAVVSQFGLMFFPDREKSLREMLRVLKPGGCISVAVWDSLISIPAISKEVEILEQIAGVKAADALRAPFILGNKAELENLAVKASISFVRVNTIRGTAEFANIRSFVEADLRGWLPVMDVILDEDVIQHILEEADIVMNDYTNEEGQAVFQISAHIISGTKTES